MNKTEFNYALGQIHKGNLSALEPIYTEYCAKLAITAKRILHDGALAEDAAADTFVKLIEYAKTHERPSIEQPGAYLYRAVKNAALDIYKKEKRSVALDNVEEDEAEDDIDNADRFTLEQALKRLGKVEAEIATMFYFYGYKIKHISQELSMPEGTVKWTLSNIRKRLREVFLKN